MPFSRVEQAIEDIRQGKPVILVDDEDRENEGDFVYAAEKITPEAINFMATHGRGLICLSLTDEKAGKLHLRPMVEHNTAQFSTAFTVSIEAREGVTTGISAADRATTILTAVREDCRPEDLARPGHVFPLIAKPGGVLQRTGQTEGSVDLARLAGLTPAGVICEIMNEDGTMARRPDLEVVAERFGLVIVSVADLIKYRRVKEQLVERYAEADVPLKFGDFHMVVYRSNVNNIEHLAFVKGEVSPDSPTLVRVQSTSVLNELLNQIGRWSKDSLGEALDRVEAEGAGVVLCLSMQGRAPRRIGDVLREAQAHGEDKITEPVDASSHSDMPDHLREYGLGAQILADLGVKKMRLLTNNPRRIPALEGFDLEIVETVPMNAEAEEGEGADVHVLKPRS